MEQYAIEHVFFVCLDAKTVHLFPISALITTVNVGSRTVLAELVVWAEVMQQ